MQFRIFVLFTLITTYYVSSVTAFDKDNPPDELQIATLYRPEKCIRKVTDDDIIKIHYTGMIYKSQKVFDSTRDKKPVQFTIGEKRVIPAWEFGSKGMCVGEIRRLLVPSKYAYGSIGVRGFVEPNEAVIFEIELVEIYSALNSPYFWLSLGALVTMFQLYWWAGRAEARKKFLKEQEEMAKKEKENEVAEEKGVSVVEEIEVSDDEDQVVLLRHKKNN